MPEPNYIERGRKLFRELIRPSTWIEPKSIIILLVGVILMAAWDLFKKRLEIRLEDRTRTASITLEYQRIEVLSLPQLSRWSQSNLLKGFNLNLDDGVLGKYSVVPFHIRNTSPIPVDAFSFHLNLGKNIRILDAQVVSRLPKLRAVKFNNNLPSGSWKWPTNTVYSYLSWDRTPPGDWVNVYASFDRHKGFGRVNPEHSEQYTVLPFAPNEKTLRWYLRLSTENGSWAEVFGEQVYPIPNPSLASMNHGDSGSATNLPVILTASGNFLNGETDLDFESGLEPNAEMSIFVLCKALDGDIISPKISLSGAHGVSFEESNLPYSFVVPESSEFESRRIELMPEMVQAYSAGSNIIFFWQPTSVMSDSKVRVFRSSGRPLGDFSEIGEKIYEGFGTTNQFVLEKFVEQKNPEQTTPPKNFDLHFAPPKEVMMTSGTNRVPDPRKPAPPSNIRVEYNGFQFDNALHIIDTPPKRETAYTYSIFVVDNKGNVSYPVVVNASLTKATENWKLKVVP